MDIATLIVVASWLPAVLFVVAYQVTAKWRETEAGRNAMALGFVVAVLLTAGLARRVFGDYRWREEIILVMYVAFTVVLWWRLVMLVRYQLLVPRLRGWWRARRAARR